MTNRAIIICIVLVGCGHAPPQDAEPRLAPADPIEGVEAMVLFERGVALAREGDLIRAEQYMATSISRGAPQEQVLPALLRVCVAGNRYRLALGYADPYLRENPDDWSLRYLVASIHLGMGDIAHARRELEQVIRDVPEEPEPHYLLAIVLRDELGDPTGAENHFRRYIPWQRLDAKFSPQSRALRQALILQGCQPGTTFPNAQYTWYGEDRTQWEQTAVFGELTWHINDDLDLTVGGRWFETTNDKQILRWHAGYLPGGDAHDLAARKQLAQDGQGALVGGGAEHGHQGHAVREVEVGVAGRAALAGHDHGLSGRFPPEGFRLLRPIAPLCRQPARAAATECSSHSCRCPGDRDRPMVSSAVSTPPHLPSVRPARRTAMSPAHARRASTPRRPRWPEHPARFGVYDTSPHLR